MLCQNVRQILARSSDAPLPGPEYQEINEHLQACAECRREEFYFKQISNVGGLVVPYQVSPNFNYKLEVRMANASDYLPPLKVSPGIRRNHGRYFSLASAGALAVLAVLLVPMVAQKETQNSPVAVPESNPIQKLSIPLLTLLAETAQASERPARQPESPIAAQFASASSEPLRPGVDGQEVGDWQDQLYWVGNDQRGFLLPVRRYSQPSEANSSPVLLLPASSTDQNVNIVY